MVKLRVPELPRPHLYPLTLVLPHQDLHQEFVPLVFFKVTESRFTLIGEISGQHRVVGRVVGEISLQLGINDSLDCFFRFLWTRVRGEGELTCGRNLSLVEG